MARMYPGPFVLLMFLVLLLPASNTRADVQWQTSSPEPPRILLYFFWSTHCPHCQEAKAFLNQRMDGQSWLNIEQAEIQDPSARQLLAEVSQASGFRPNAVPAFFFCGRGMTGFGSGETTGTRLIASLADCYERHYGTLPPGYIPEDHSEPQTQQQLNLPLVGPVDPTALSLPALTLVMALMDAFNPCAFFVLLFLLSLLTHTHDRGRMLLIGGVFVVVSGLIYFLFMSAWLNLFSMLGHLWWLTLAAGMLAIVLGALNIKDFFRSGDQISLSMTDNHRTDLFQRMRVLIGEKRNIPVLASTVMLAVMANSYEALCTAGFPMVYTRTLTLAQLPDSSYYGYLAVYNLIYVLPLSFLLIAYVYTLGRRRLSEREGHALKLLSGLMMAGLGIALVTDPGLLANPLAAAALMLGALLLTLVMTRLFPR